MCIIKQKNRKFYDFRFFETSTVGRNFPAPDPDKEFRLISRDPIKVIRWAFALRSTQEIRPRKIEKVKEK